MVWDAESQGSGDAGDTETQWPGDAEIHIIKIEKSRKGCGVRQSR